MIPKTALELLEFHKLLRHIADFANSAASNAYIFSIGPLSSRDDVEIRLKQVGEIRKLTHEGTPLRLYPFSDLSPYLIKIRPEGAVLEAIELAEFIPVLNIAAGIGQTIEDRFDIPSLKQLAGYLTGFPDILKTLQKSIDAEGNVLDSASFLLADLRAQIRKLEVRIRKKLEELTRDEKLSVFLQDDFVTTRSGRWVIPVRMDSKGMVPGVVHDVSKSGETAFIEPLAIINLSNELENLVAEQKAEELRILRTICAAVRKVIDEFEREFRTVVSVDVLNSIARFADKLNMENPVITKSDHIYLTNARHPLLQLALSKTDASRQVVPLDIMLGGDHTVMVITGANAGGKTIAIKTIGLLVVMALSGMPVPADSSSSIPFVEHLLIDIGDEQSIENNLSTFSAHMSNISEIVKNRDSGAVVLIDELGTGTDPDEGGALACAILKHIRRSGALVFATTHLSDIKGFVHRTEGMLNASMEFDYKTFTPLFRLRVGEPGQSHALDIAKRYGIPGSLIEDARTMIGSMKVELDHMISDLQAKRLEHENALQALEMELSAVKEKDRLLDKVLAETKEKQKVIIAEAYREASGLVTDTKRQMNIFLDEVKKKEKADRQKAIKKIEEAQETITAKLRELDVDDMRTPSIDEIKKGDVVSLRSLGHDASVIEVNKKSMRVKVSAKNMEIEVPLTDITFAKGRPPVIRASFPKAEKSEETIPLKINFIGLRVDDALSKLERFLNDAALSELPEIIVVHGIGKGLLSKAIHEHLNGHPLVEKYRSGTLEEGGAAVTIVTMR